LIIGGGDVLGLSTKVRFSKSLGLSSVRTSKAFEFGVFWHKGAEISGTLAFEGAVRFSLGFFGLLTIDLGNTGRDAGFEGAIGGVSSRKLTRRFRFAFCCNLTFG
jgi:hypothetical protein